MSVEVPWTVEEEVHATDPGTHRRNETNVIDVGILVDKRKFKRNEVDLSNKGK